MIALDTETTGLDFNHGCRPFLVTTCDEQGENTYWEWDVDPSTRKVRVPRKDLGEIRKTIRNADSIVLQNSKFDVKALESIGIKNWPWYKTHDTLIAGHLLVSNQPHDLTTMAVVYLSADVSPLERDLEKATVEARAIAKGSGWRIAKAGLPELPSAKGKTWKYDTWAPRAIAQSCNYHSAHAWFDVCADYANTDSAATIALFKRQRELLENRGLWEIYLARLQLLPIITTMERQGVSLSRSRLVELQQTYTQELGAVEDKLLSIAKSYGCELEIPKGGSNNSLREFIFKVLDLPPLQYSEKTQEPSLNRATLDHWQATLPEGKPKEFIIGLGAKRRRSTALSYLEGYKRFWLPVSPKTEEWYRLFPSLNITGTDTLRFSSQNPNEQNISKQEGFNLRYCFGPLPGREWWSLDYKNLELRIPAYEAEETEMIGLFEKPDEPPFFGSNHLLVFSILHPDKYDKKDPKGLLKAKKKYASTWYQWTKNGNFAVQYGAVEQSGTADLAYHVPGGQHRIQKRFGRIKELNEKLIAQANDQGYVETIPDRTVDPNRGYPLYCMRTRWGKVQPTIPLNYHVQGTAMWIASKGMVYCQEYLDQLNAKPKSLGYHMIMQVHDEIVFDFPKGKTPKSNLPKIRRLQSLMAKAGDDVGIPTPVSIEYHPDNWGATVSV